MVDVINGRPFVVKRGHRELIKIIPLSCPATKLERDSSAFALRGRSKKLDRWFFRGMSGESGIFTTSESFFTSTARSTDPARRFSGSRLLISLLNIRVIFSVIFSFNSKRTFGA